MKTTLPKITALKHHWYLIDASDQVVGKIAVVAARVLAGKNRVDFTPHIDLGDGIIVINASKARLTGQKPADKIYRTHSGYKGHLKEISAADLIKKNPAKLLKLAVAGMLPKNKLRASRLERLRVFPGAEHNNKAQKPETLTI